MKNLFYIVLLIGLIAYGGYTWHQNKQAEKRRARDEFIARQIAQQEEAARAEAKAKREKQEKQERDALINSFRAFLAQEQARLNKAVEESNITIALIKEDQKTLSDEIKRLDEENDKKEESARKRGKIRYDKAERILSLLGSEKINELAEKYTGEDLSAMKAEYKSRIEQIIKMHKETKNRLANNRKKYENAVRGIDDDVDAKSAKAKAKISSANADLEQTLSGLYKTQRSIEGKITKLAKGMQSPATRKESAELEKELIKLKKKIADVEQVVALSRANVAHVEATTAETAARRKYDSAITARQEDDNAVHSDMAHERTIFNTALTYEGRSVDRIRNSMQARIDIMGVRIVDAQRILDYITTVTKNPDLMTAKEIEDVRSKIVKKIQDGLGDIGK